jgi:hypothetical protein
MNVIGLARSVSRARHRAISASAGAASNARPPRRASSSITAKPMLCRVARYFGPGFPSPTMSFTKSQNIRLKSSNPQILKS